MDETLTDVAPDEGQPTDEAVAEAPSAEPSAEPGTSAASSEEPAPSRLYAGKYKSDEELERGYLESQREASRLAGELASYRRAQPTPQMAAEPEWKKLETERNKWAQYAAQPGLSEDQRANAWNQVSLHDRDIAEQRAITRFQEMSTKQSAAKDLEADAQAVFETYQQDLSPGSPLYAAAEQRYFQMVKAGYPESTSLKADAVLWAAHKTGTVKAKAVSQDRKDFLGHLNKQAKAAQKAGAGTATQVKSGSMTAQQIRDLPDAEFAKWEREHVLGV